MSTELNSSMVKAIKATVEILIQAFVGGRQMQKGFARHLIVE